MRGIAALCVLAYHASGGTASNAYLAVDFFFMLSGYVMARTYEGSLVAGMPPAKMLAARMRRLWPTMFVAGLVAAPGLASMLPSHQFWPILIANLMLVPNFTHNRVYLLNGSAWSILLELLANAAHACVLWRLSTARIVMGLVPLAALLAYCGADHALELGATPATFAAGLPRVLVSYGIGIVLWRIWRDQPSFKVSAVFTWAAMPAIFLLFALLKIRSLPGDLLFVLAVCPVLIAGALRLERIPRLLARLGAISFPLYAVHIPVMVTASSLGLGTGWSALLSIPVAWLLLHLMPRLTVLSERGWTAGRAMINRSLPTLATARNLP